MASNSVDLACPHEHPPARFRRPRTRLRVENCRFAAADPINLSRRAMRRRPRGRMPRWILPSRRGDRLLPGQQGGFCRGRPENPLRIPTISNRCATPSKIARPRRWRALLMPDAEDRRRACAGGEGDHLLGHGHLTCPWDPQFALPDRSGWRPVPGRPTWPVTMASAIRQRELSVPWTCCEMPMPQKMIAFSARAYLRATVFSVSASMPQRSAIASGVRSLTASRTDSKSSVCVVAFPGRPRQNRPRRPAAAITPARAAISSATHRPRGRCRHCPCARQLGQQRRSGIFHAKGVFAAAGTEQEDVPLGQAEINGIRGHVGRTNLPPPARGYQQQPPARQQTPSFRDAPLGAGPASIIEIVVMDSGLVLRTPRNDG